MVIGAYQLRGCGWNIRILAINRSMQSETRQLTEHEAFDLEEILPEGHPRQPSPRPSQPPIMLIDQPNMKVFCGDCRRELRGTAVLSRGAYRCVGCFARKEPTAEPYTVVGSLDYSLFEYGWKASRELLLLSFLEKYGFGNWGEIKDQLEFFGCRLEEKLIEAHYCNTYLASEDFLPRVLNNDSFFERQSEQGEADKQPGGNPTSMASLATTARERQSYEDVEDAYAERCACREGQWQGYFNPRRGEFEAEYDEEAEQMLAHLEFREDDSEQERRLKFAIIEEYNARLDRRGQVKDFVLEHRLLEAGYQRQMEKTRSDFENEAFRELRPIARFTTLTEYSQLVRKVAFSKQLKSVVEGLRNFRRAHPSGSKSLQEWAHGLEAARPRKRQHLDGVKSGRRVEELLERQFRVSQKDFENLVGELQLDGKRARYKNMEAVMIQRNY